MLLAVFVGVCLAKTLQPLHANRAGQHAAGRWLAERLKPGDIIQDDHCWTHYYAGQVFEEDHLRPRPRIMPVVQEKKCYIVMTRSRDEDIARDRFAREDEIRSKNGAVVYRWPAHAAEKEARVVVYAVVGD